MACFPLMLCLWGQTKCPNKSLAMATSTRSHRITVWRCDKEQVMGTHTLPPTSGPGNSLGGIFPQPCLRQDSSPIKCSIVSPHKAFTLEHFQHKSAWAGCLLLQLLHFSSVQNKAFPKCLLWLESAHPLSWSLWNAGIFQRKRKHPVLAGIFHGYTLPRGDLSLQGNFQHCVIFGFFLILLFVSTEAGR